MREFLILFLTAALGVLVMICSIWTYERNIVWSSEVALWKDCVEKSPNKARPHNNLGLALAAQGNLEEAMRLYSKALEINPDFVGPHYNLVLALAKQGKLERAISHFSKAV